MKNNRRTLLYSKISFFNKYLAINTVLCDFKSGITKTPQGIEQSQLGVQQSVDYTKLSSPNELDEWSTSSLGRQREEMNQTAKESLNMTLELQTELNTQLSKKNKRSFLIINNEAEKKRSNSGTPEDDLIKRDLPKKKKVKKRKKRPLPAAQENLFEYEHSPISKIKEIKMVEQKRETKEPNLYDLDQVDNQKIQLRSKKFIIPPIEILKERDSTETATIETGKIGFINKRISKIHPNIQQKSTIASTVKAFNHSEIEQGDSVTS